MKRFLLILFVGCGFIFSGIAQDLPNTNIYLFEMEQDTGGAFLFRSPKFLTEFNQDNYNNQPCFVGDDLLYFSARLPNSNQNDIYAFDLEKGTKLQVTKTAESEYSPTLMPDGFSFSAVRVEVTDDRIQRLWEFPIDRLNNGKPVFQFMTRVGYHHWIDRYRVALFLVGEPNELVIANLRNGSVERITTNVGRCFQTSPNGRLVFIDKASKTTWFIKALDLSQGSLKSEVIVRTLPGSEDFVVLTDGTILLGNGTKLYKYHPRKDTDWQEIADFRRYNISSITRLAVNGNGKIALVASPSPLGSQ